MLNVIILQEARNDAAIARDAGANLEYNVPIETKADQVISILEEGGIDDINVVITPQ